MDVAVARAVAVMARALDASTPADLRNGPWLEALAAKVLAAGWLPWSEELHRLREIVSKHPDRLAGPHVDRVEAAAKVLHSRRHRLGWGSVCGRCRDDAAAVLAAVAVR